jgi:hypothetical protein
MFPEKDPLPVRQGQNVRFALEGDGEGVAVEHWDVPYVQVLQLSVGIALCAAAMRPINAARQAF